MLRFNKEEKRAIGLTLIDFSVLIQLTNLGPRSFPLTGLKDLETERQEIVLEIVQKEPVNQDLKILAYTPSMSETMPITVVAKPPIPLAV